jgi:hypothetical protein
MASKKYLVISDLRGGRNGADAPLSLPDTQCVEAMNVDYYDATLGRKRNGAVTSVESLWPGVTTPVGIIASMCHGTVGGDSAALYVDSTGIVNFVSGYFPANASGDAVDVGDAVASNFTGVTAATFANRTYVCYDSSVDRLHFWAYDATHSTNTFYRVGLPAPTAAPTVVNVGGGDQWPDTRHYKVAWIYKQGSDIQNRSELSAVVEYDPATTAGPMRVTCPATPSGEAITHWELYGSSDGITFVLLTTVAIATTTYDDADRPSTYQGDAAPVVGTNMVPGSWKYIVTDGNRLIGAGNYEGGNQSRVWYTPVYGALDIGDSERVPPSNYMDVDAYDGDAITGLSCFMGNIVVFKSRQIGRLVPTGDATAPYRFVSLTKAIGCVAPKSICVGEDENGSPALYFMSHRGPYRIGVSGLQYVGRDIEDITSQMRQSATVICHAAWYQTKHQMWFWIATGSDAYPSVKLVLDTQLGRSTTGGVRGGWTRHTGISCRAACSMMYGKLGFRSGNNREDLVPWVGSGVTTALILRCDEPNVYTDNGTAYQAYVKTKPYPLGGLGFNCAVGQSHLTAKAGASVEITQTLDRDYGAETRTSTCMLTPDGTETRVQRQFEGSDMAGAGVVQIQLGDAAATSQSWTLDALVIPYQQQEER